MIINKGQTVCMMEDTKRHHFLLDIEQDTIFLNSLRIQISQPKNITAAKNSQLVNSVRKDSEEYL